MGNHTFCALCSIWVSKMISFPGYQTSCSRAVWRWEGSSLGTAENLARIVSIFLTLQAPSGQLKNKEVWGENPVLLTPRFCQALVRQGSEASVSRSCSSDPGPLTMQEGKLRPREGLICPGHTVKQHRPRPPPDMAPSPVWRPPPSAEAGWECAPHCPGSHGRLPWPRPLMPKVAIHFLPTSFV